MQILAIAGGGAGGPRAFLDVERCLPSARPGAALGEAGRKYPGVLPDGSAVRALIEQSTAGPQLRAAVLVGFLGTFTTFSTFSLETLALIEEGYLGRAFVNTRLSVSVCLAACWAGLLLGRSW